MVNRIDMELMHFRYIICMLSSYVHPPDEGPSVLTTAPNTILTCVILSEFLDSIRDYNLSFSTELEKLSKRFIQVAEDISAATTDLHVHEATFASKSVGEAKLYATFIHKPMKYRAFLNHSLTKEIVIKRWTGNKSTELGFGFSSYVFKAFESSHSPQQMWSCHKKKLQLNCCSVFQFDSWLENCNVRHSVEIQSLGVYRASDLDHRYLRENFQPTRQGA
jgi:hypothetical protein